MPASPWAAETVVNGISREELKDALIQVGIYCGVPAGVEAFRIATRVLKELEVEGTPK